MNPQAKEFLPYSTFNVIRPATPPEHLITESEHCDEDCLMLVDRIKRNVESNKKTTLISERLLDRVRAILSSQNVTLPLMLTRTNSEEYIGQNL
ncbi:hypothetical protein BJ944DRAFT_241333 [Cunninghamella echinulata]|nr:hypothetical protein BJ944DRAFT_241333 [Cunninghamella echinulata]